MLWDGSENKTLYIVLCEPNKYASIVTPEFYIYKVGLNSPALFTTDRIRKTDLIQVALDRKIKSLISKFYWLPQMRKVSCIIKDFSLKLQQSSVLEILINAEAKDSATEILYYDLKKVKLLPRREVLDKPGRILKKSAERVWLEKKYKGKQERRQEFLSKDLLNLRPTYIRLNAGFENLCKVENALSSELAVILLGCLMKDLHIKKDFDFTGFCRMYSDCVEHLASLPEMTLSADTISEWRRKGNLRETEAEIYDFMRGDRYLLPETMLSMAFGLRKLYVEEMMKSGSEKAKEKAGGFIRERLSEVLKISGASPMKKLLEDLKAGGPFDNSAKELCARLLAPVKPLKYEKVENKTKQIDGVPASWLYVSPFKTPKELAERVASLKEIEDEQEASNYAFMLLFALKDKIEWICDGKMSMDGYINTADTLISKINPEKPLTTGLKKHWHPYFKRIRRKAYRDFITAALLPAYFRMKILATLHEKTVDGQNRKDSEEIAKFIRRESGNIIKSIPAPPITAMCRMVSQNPFISDEELYPKLK